MEREFNDMKDVFKVLPTTQEEKEYMIVIGKHLATNEKFPTREAAEDRINSIDWNLISAMIYASGFRFYFTPLPGFFSPFPHGTGSLSIDDIS